MIKDGKIFGKINIIDLLVIIVLIAAIAGIGYRLLGARSAEVRDMQNFEYVVRVDNIRQQTAQALEKKGKVYADKNNVETGEIVSVTVQPYKQEAITTKGEQKFAETPEKFTAYVTIRVNGTCSQGTYYDNDKTEIGAGRGHKICSRDVATTGEIVSVKPIE
ncbi:MAG: DUF4330 domain-containing protein [Clostridia bacterium]|nr:DUF4330 domain-containing protein [Clostridia bacterium]